MEASRQKNRESVTVDDDDVCGYCDDGFDHNEKTVVVVAGDYVEYRNEEFTVNTTTGEAPTIEVWHEPCAEAHGFEVNGNHTAMKYFKRLKPPFVNAATIAAFLMGVALMYIVAAGMIV